MTDEEVLFGYHIYEDGRLVEASQVRAPTLALADREIDGRCEARRGGDRTRDVGYRVWDIKRACTVCGDWVPASERCTNGRCRHCHPLHCSPGGETSPGHNPIPLDQRVTRVRPGADPDAMLTLLEHSAEDAMRRFGRAVFAAAQTDPRFRNRVTARSSELGSRYALCESTEAARIAATAVYVPRPRRRDAGSPES